MFLEKVKDHKLRRIIEIFSYIFVFNSCAQSSTYFLRAGNRIPCPYHTAQNATLLRSPYDDESLGSNLL